MLRAQSTFTQENLDILRNMHYNIYNIPPRFPRSCRDILRVENYTLKQNTFYYDNNNHNNNNDDGNRIFKKYIQLSRKVLQENLELVTFIRRRIRTLIMLIMINNNNNKCTYVGF